MTGELDDIFAGAEHDLANKPEKIKLERDIQADSMAAARKAGWWAAKWNAPKRKGVLDVIFLRAPRRVVFVEFKRPGEKPTEIQAATIFALEMMGFPCYVCTSVEETLEALRRH